MAETPPAAGATPPPATDAAAATAAAAAGAAANPPSQPGAAAAPAVADEQMPPGATPPAGEQPKPPEQQQPPAGAPEKYALTLPPETPLDATDVASFETFARTHNLTNEQAQGALKEHSDAVAANNTRLREALERDPEVGGANLAAAQQRANAVLDRFLPATTPEGQELRQVLTKQGLGNYAPVVRLLNNIGKAMGEDQPLNERGAGGGGGQRDAANILFGGGNKS